MKMIATTVRYKNTFLLVGGRYLDTYYGGSFINELSNIIKYEPDTGGWTILPQTLAYKNAGYVRMMVKSVIFPSCAVGKKKENLQCDNNIII